MEWLEMKIDTSHAGLDPVCAMLEQQGVTGLMIDDETDFQDFLEHNRQYWDYVDEALLAEKRGVSRVTFYLERNENALSTIAAVRMAMSAMKKAHPEYAPLRLTMDNVADADWENNWKQFYKPMEIGDRLLVVPEWEQASDPQRITLRLNPGLTFGTGSHATTRLCLQALDRCIHGGEKVLDLGCGSGILSIGALVLGALNRAGIEIVTHIGRCAGISDAPFALDDPAALAAQAEALLNKSEGFALLDGSVEEPMKAAIRAAGAEGDSVGGVLETAILGLPAGVGEPYFDSVESKLAHLAFSIPAVKGIEFGSGFGFADQKGSEANDAFRMQGERIVTATNHNAGLNGGISNGMPVVFRTAVKPTPSIYKTQDTVDYIAKKDAELSIQGRHDPCIVPRAAIVQTCAAALAVGDLLTAKYGMAWMEDPTGYRKEVL